MLWIGGQLSPNAIITGLFLPAIVSILAPLGITMLSLKGNVEREIPLEPSERKPIKAGISIFVLLFGLALLLSVPLVRIGTNLPPYMAILLALGVLWLVTELIRNSKLVHSSRQMTVTGALHEIDLPSILFFTDILLGVAALQSAGILSNLANWLRASLGNFELLMVLIGPISAIVDNVPLVSAIIQMFPLDQIPRDSQIWQLLAFSAGTGGSLLIIGSAAGISAMGTTKISFGWYCKHFSLPVLLGFAMGIGVFFLQKL